MPSMNDRRLIREIRLAVATGELVEPFRARDIIDTKSIECAPSTPGTFLPKHRVGNPGGNTELFILVTPGLYRLKPIEC